MNVRRFGTRAGLSALLVVAVASLGLFGCSDDDAIIIIPVNPAEIRVIHLSPTAPAVDVYVDNTVRAFRDVEFEEGTPRVDLPAGTYSFQVVAAGEPPVPAVLSFDDVNLAAGVRYTAVAFDTLENIQGLALVDNFSPPGEGNIRVRPMHAAPAVGQVDIWEVSDPASPVLLYEDVDFGGVGDYAILPSGSYTLGFDTDNDGVPELVFETGPLPAGSVVNVFAVNDDESNIFLLAQFQNNAVVRIDPTPPPPPAEIRVIHLSPDAPAVDVYVDSTILAFEDVAFQAGTNRAELPAGTYSFQVVAVDAPPDPAVLSFDDLPLAAGGSYTAVAYDVLANITGLALADDFSSPGAGNIRVRPIHAAPGVGEVDIWEVSDPADPVLLYENVAFGDVGAYAILGAGSYTLGFDTDDDGVPELVFETGALAEGSIINLFAVNDGPDVFLLAQFEDDTVARIDPNP